MRGVEDGIDAACRDADTLATISAIRASPYGFAVSNFSSSPI
jgi:hypothetical protein